MLSCLRTRIPRTKQEIQLRLYKQSLTKEFRKYLNMLTISTETRAGAPGGVKRLWPVRWPIDSRTRLETTRGMPFTPRRVMGPTGPSQ